MNTTSKADLISNLMAGLHTPSDIPDWHKDLCADWWACTDPIPWEAPWMPYFWRPIAGVFMQIATLCNTEANWQVYWRTACTIPTTYGAPSLPWMKTKLIYDKDTKSTRWDQTRFLGNHEESDTRLILHACKAADRIYERVLVICRVTDVLLLLLNFMPVVEVWMITGTAKNRKSYPVHEISQRLTQPVRDILLSCHVLTGCDTTSAFSGHGKKSCWKTFQNHPFLVSGVGHDGELAPVEKILYHLYGTQKQPIINIASN